MIYTYKYSIFSLFFPVFFFVCDKQLAISLELAFTRSRNLLHRTLPLQHTNRAASTLCTEIPAHFCGTRLSSRSHILDSQHSNMTFFPLCPPAEHLRGWKSCPLLKSYACGGPGKAAVITQRLSEHSSVHSSLLGGANSHKLLPTSYLRYAVTQRKRRKRIVSLSLEGEDIFLLMVRSCFIKYSFSLFPYVTLSPL